MCATESLCYADISRQKTVYVANYRGNIVDYISILAYQLIQYICVSVLEHELYYVCCLFLISIVY